MFKDDASKYLHADYIVSTVLRTLSVDITAVSTGQFPLPPRPLPGAAARARRLGVDTS
jgi:hypothetical protein